MKINHLFPITLACLAFINCSAVVFPRYTTNENDTVQKIKGHENLFFHEGTYISGQLPKS